MINSFHTIVANRVELLHPYSLRAFERYQERGMKHHGLGDLNTRSETNYLASYIDLNSAKPSANLALNMRRHEWPCELEYFDIS
jgi:hypothetical protein